MNCVYFMFYFLSYYFRGLIFVIEGFTVRIKFNRILFVFEFGIKLNIICEFDCGDYNWKCIYQWIVEKKGIIVIYNDKNNLCIDIFLIENVIFMCFVKFENNNRIYNYSEKINIFIEGNFVNEFLG